MWWISYLVFFLFECGFCLLESGLEFFLLDFEALALLLDLVDVAATFSDLIHQVLDLIRQVLVLAASAFQVLLAFIVGSLETEEFGRVVAALLLGSVQLGREVIHLSLPFSDDLVEVLSALLHLGGQLLSALNLDLHVFDISGQALLDLFQSHDLLVERFDGFFGFTQTGLEFPPAGQKFKKKIN